MANFQFDERKFMKDISQAAEIEAKKKITEKVRRVAPNVKVSFTGSVQGNNMKINLSGPEDELANAQKSLTS